jgi:hypothetical protein
MEAAKRLIFLLAPELALCRASATIVAAPAAGGRGLLAPPRRAGHAGRTTPQAAPEPHRCSGLALPAGLV